MAGVCLQPFYDYLTTFINDHSGAVSCDELARLHKSEPLGELNPCSIVLLLSDLCSDKIRFHNNFFTTLPETVVTDLETNVFALLAASPNPVHVNVLTTKLWPTIRLENEAALQCATSVIMDHCPDVGATTDQRYFLYTTSVMPLLYEIMSHLKSPAHYRTVTNHFNHIVKTRSRKGAGYILEMLNQSDRCTRVDRGLYVLHN